MHGKQPGSKTTPAFFYDKVWCRNAGEKTASDLSCTRLLGSKQGIAGM